MHKSLAAWALSLGMFVLAVGCGDEGGGKKPPGDGGLPDAPTADSPAEDAPTGDAPMGGSVEITGFVRNPGGDRIEGVQVRSYSAANALLGTDTTDDNGEFTVSGEPDSLVFVRVDPTEDELGLVVAYRIAPDVTALDIDGGLTIETRADFEDDVVAAAQTPDDTKGHVVLGFTFGGADMQERQDAADAATGLGAVIDVDGEDEWQNYILDSNGNNGVLRLFGDGIPALCSSLPGVICRDNADIDEPMFFVNVDPGSADIDLTLTGALDCSFRSGHDGSWPVFADTRTLVVVDCALADL